MAIGRIRKGTADSSCHLIDEHPLAFLGWELFSSGENGVVLMTIVHSDIRMRAAYIRSFSKLDKMHGC